MKNLTKLIKNRRIKSITLLTMLICVIGGIIYTAISGSLQLSIKSMEER